MQIRRCLLFKSINKEIIKEKMLNTQYLSRKSSLEFPIKFWIWKVIFWGIFFRLMHSDSKAIPYRQNTCKVKINIKHSQKSTYIVVSSFISSLFPSWEDCSSEVASPGLRIISPSSMHLSTFVKFSTQSVAGSPLWDRIVDINNEMNKCCLI